MLEQSVLRRALFVYGTAPMRRARRAARGQPAARGRGLERHRVPGRDTFFGYYDVCPLSKDGERLLATAVPEGLAAAVPEAAATIGYFDRNERGRNETGKFVELDTTSTWCWQMGCRLRFMPGSGDRAVIYNRPEGGRHGARIRSLADPSDSRPLPFPLYDVAPCGSFGLFVDFSRLNWLRPGYGYPPMPDDRRPAPDDGGIWRGDLRSGSSELLFSLSGIAGVEPDARMEGAWHYVNHLSIGPDGERFFFLHLWTRAPGSERDWGGRMLTAKCDGTDLRPIASAGRPSHYCWIDPNRLVVTMIGEGSRGASYRVVDVEEGDKGPFWPHLPEVDGHPSLSADGQRLLTDTYHDRYNEQRLLIVEKGGAVEELGRFRPAFDAWGPRRCDLHPRWVADEAAVAFDSTHDRGRALYLLPVGPDFGGGLA